jgi:hypothetical protein
MTWWPSTKQAWFSGAGRFLPTPPFIRLHALCHQRHSAAAWRTENQILNTPPAWLAIGLLTRIVATVTNVEMLVIIFVFTWQFGYFCTNRGIEFALPWALPFIGGGGRYSSIWEF